MKKGLKQIVEPIVKWYQKQEKTLPWKQDKEPYRTLSYMGFRNYVTTNKN